MEREQRLCQRCEGSSVDDVEHMIFDCTSLEAEEASVFVCTWKGDLADFFEQDQIELAALFTAVSRHAMSSEGVTVRCEVID